MPTVLQISAGQGPAECRVFVPLLAEVIRREAGERGLTCLPLTASSPPKEAGSLRFSVKGEGLDAFRASWEGTVKWIWQSTLRPRWPRKNWFVKVSFFDFSPEDSGQLKTADLRIETCRASGPGGQHVNTTDTAVRIVQRAARTAPTATRTETIVRRRRSLIPRALSGTTAWRTTP